MSNTNCTEMDTTQTTEGTTMTTQTADARAYRIYFGGATDRRLSPGTEAYDVRSGKLLMLTSAAGRIQTDDPKGNYRTAMCVLAHRDVTALSEAEFDDLPEARLDAE
jgi:hypothetical protein